MASNAKSQNRPQVQWLAILGALGVVVGVNLYKMGRRDAGMVLFPLGWVLVALAINRSNYQRNQTITFVGAALVVIGAGAARMAFDKKMPAPKFASFMFLLGWTIIAASAGGYSSELHNKEILSYLGAALVVGGAMYTARLEKSGAKQMPGKGVFMLGWFVLVLGISLD
jgi:FtsH-binding integral membrane protein